MLRTGHEVRRIGLGRGRVLAAGLALAVLGSGGGEAWAQDLKWDLNGAIEVVPGTHGTALRLQQGSADLQGVELENGSISFVLKATEARGFIGIRARIGEDGSFENFYLRPHKNNAPDALQYTPSFGHGDSNWQLYHGPGGTMPAPTQDTVDGIAVEIVFDGSRAALFIGDDDEPALNVPRLALETRSGGIRLYGGVLQPTADSLSVRFENIRIDRNSTRVIPPVDVPTADEGTVMAWGLGEVYRTQEMPDAVPEATRYNARNSEAGGMLLIERHITRPDGDGVVAVAAGLTIESDSEQRVAMELGFSDLASVFLNGEKIFEGDLRYSYEGPMRQGFFVPQNTLFLPLNAGRNELVIVVAESFGGWALSARFPDGEVRTRPMR